MKQTALFLPHYDPFMGCGTTMKSYCNTDGLDYHQFRKWRIRYEQSNKPPIIYNACSAKREKLKKGITSPLHIIYDSTPKEQLIPNHQAISVDLKLPKGIDLHISNSTTGELLHIIRGLKGAVFTQWITVLLPVQCHRRYAKRNK